MFCHFYQVLARIFGIDFLPCLAIFVPVVGLFLPAFVVIFYFDVTIVG